MKNFSKSFLSIIAAFVLFGLANCMFIEPALALSDQETACANEEHCCFICNSGQHKWNVLKNVDFTQPSQITVRLVSIPFPKYTYFLPDSIYHPPPVSLRI